MSEKPYEEVLRRAAHSEAKTNRCKCALCNLGRVLPRTDEADAAFGAIEYMLMELEGSLRAERDDLARRLAVAEVDADRLRHRLAAVRPWVLSCDPVALALLDEDCDAHDALVAQREGGQ